MTTREDIISGGRELQELLDTLPNKMQKNINRAGMRAGAAVLLAEVKQRIPVASGNLRRTARITTRANGGQVSASVKVGGIHRGVDGWYAHLVEFGTRPHVIRSKPRSAMDVNGTPVREVQHPGSRAHPFMRPSVDTKFTEAIDAVKAKIRERLTTQGLNTPAPVPMDAPE